MTFSWSDLAQRHEFPTQVPFMSRNEGTDRTHTWNPWTSSSHPSGWSRRACWSRPFSFTELVAPTLASWDFWMKRRRVFQQWSFRVDLQSCHVTTWHIVWPKPTRSTSRFYLQTLSLSWFHKVSYHCHMISPDSWSSNNTSKKGEGRSSAHCPPGLPPGRCAVVLHLCDQLAWPHLALTMQRATSRNAGTETICPGRASWPFFVVEAWWFFSFFCFLGKVGARGLELD